MPDRIHKCLVTLARGDVTDPCVVPCVVDGEHSFILIPVGHYALPRAGGHAQMKLKAEASWFRAVHEKGYDLVCENIIDLDKFDELPWIDVQPPLEG